MSADSTEALRRLVATLEEHLEAVAMRRGDTDAAVDDAYEAVAAEFERYEEMLDSEFGESLPIVLEDVDIEEYDDDTGEDEVPDGIALDSHAVEDDDDMDDDIDAFDLR
ncbi:MAG: primosomal protein [Demequina sp.]